MGPWCKIDELRRRVVTKPVVEINAEVIKTLGEAQEALSKGGFAPDRLVIFGWEILLSRRMQDGIMLWHLSAKLHPRGRSSNGDDWEIVGRIAARVGAPRDPVRMPDDLSAPVHWSWIEQCPAAT